MSEPRRARCPAPIDVPGRPLRLSPPRRTSSLHPPDPGIHPQLSYTRLTHNSAMASNRFQFAPQTTAIDDFTWMSDIPAAFVPDETTLTWYVTVPRHMLSRD
jgi:hypothetical protein